MEFPLNCEFKEVVAIGEMSTKNANVGTSWLETKTFPHDTPIDQIMRWAFMKGINGKLIITINDQ